MHKNAQIPWNMPFLGNLKLLRLQESGIWTWIISGFEFKRSKSLIKGVLDITLRDSLIIVELKFNYCKRDPQNKLTWTPNNRANNRQRGIIILADKTAEKPLRPIHCNVMKNVMK